MLRQSTIGMALLYFLGNGLAEAAGPGCGCAATPSYVGVTGVGGGIAGLGSLYGSMGVYGSRDPNSFQSGFESLPNMDGGGVHNRLPYHSYRRPWAHPGIPDKSINIVW